MKKFLILFVGLMLISISLKAFDPIRISIISTPSTTANLVVDVLNSDGTTKLAIIPSTSMTTNASGVLSVILDNNAWTSSYGNTTYPYLANDLLRITFGGVVLSIERMEVVISKQSLYGAKITPEEIDQTDDFTFQKIGILESGGTPTYYTYLQGGDQTTASDITYTLPTAAPTSDGQVLSSTTAGVTSWATPSGGGGGATHYVGQLHDGGVVFWVDQTGEHGLICSMIDLSTSQVWSDVTAANVPAPRALSDWDGQTNTTAIVAQSTATSAADLCDAYTNAEYGTGIYSDWYLPSRGELNDLWNSLKAVQKALDSDGSAATTAIIPNLYWSSSEYNDGSAWYFSFVPGGTYSYDKTSTYYVRAVRAF